MLQTEIKLNILMVDDRPENLVALEAILDSPRINLRKCLTGEDALRSVLQDEYALILLDVQMPGMDGYETAKLIKSREKSKDIPIIFITAIYNKPEQMQAGYHNGGIDYILKPFDPDILRSKVDQLVQMYLKSKHIEQQAIRLEEKKAELEAANQALLRTTSELRKAEALARVVGETSSDTILIVDRQYRIVSVNPAVKAMFGYNPEELAFRSVVPILPHDFQGMRLGGGDPPFTAPSSYELPVVRKDGSHFPAEIVVNECRLNGDRLFVCTIRDVSERVEQIERLRYMAKHDELTGLPNRSRLYDRMGELIAGQSPFSLILLDLDNFKTINDTLGHHFGDELLSRMGELFQKYSSPANTVYRLGGDEFAILIDSDANPAERAAALALQVLEAIDQPFQLENIMLSLSASLGGVTFPEHGRDIQTLLRCADVAMYKAKRDLTGYVAYSEQFDRNNLDSLRLMGDLRAAIKNDELYLEFQPKVIFRTGELAGVEALVRWEHRVLGRISPADFIPLAEKLGVIHSLTEWVLERAIRRCREWRQQGIELGVAINLSARNLQDNELPGKIGKLLAHYGVPAEAVTLEITESFIMADPERAKEILLVLRAMGICLSLDDFGTGYSSLEYLKNLPVNSLKIDQSFIRDMNIDHTDNMIIRSVIYLAHNLGMEVVAEGVEDEVSWRKLNEYGCDIAQGYFIGKPMMSERLIDWFGTETTDTGKWRGLPDSGEASRG